MSFVELERDYNTIISKVLFGTFFASPIVAISSPEIGFSRFPFFRQLSAL